MNKTQTAIEAKELPPKIEGKWISVETEMPKNGKFVLATYVNCLGNRRSIIGYFIKQYSLPSNSEDNYDEYREEDGISYLKEGWYEQQDNWEEYSSIYVNEGMVDFWSELPSTKQLPTPPNKEHEDDT